MAQQNVALIMQNAEAGHEVIVGRMTEQAAAAINAANVQSETASRDAAIVRAQADAALTREAAHREELQRQVLQRQADLRQRNLAEQERLVNSQASQVTSDAQLRNQEVRYQQRYLTPMSLGCSKSQEHSKKDASRLQMHQQRHLKVHQLTSRSYTESGHHSFSWLSIWFSFRWSFGKN